MTKTLRFLGVYVFALATTLGIALGGAWMWLGIGILYGMVILGDELLGEDLSEPTYRLPGLLNAFLYLAIPALALLCVALAWMAGSGDLLGIGAWVQATFGHDMFAARSDTGPLHWLGGILSAALTFATIGTNIGHELTHRTTDRAAMGAGRWLLALTLDAEFSIEHVYGHHRRLATPRIPPLRAVASTFIPFSCGRSGGRRAVRQRSSAAA